MLKLYRLSYIKGGTGEVNQQNVKDGDLIQGENLVLSYT